MIAFFETIDNAPSVVAMIVTVAFWVSGYFIVKYLEKNE